MGVPMRMRCDNCGYDFVGQLQYSDQRQGDVIRCKACEYEVPMISDEEIAEVETMLNKERNFAIYALIAWAVCFVAMVVWGLSYFWQAGQGLGSDKTKNKDEIIWSEEGYTALYLRANLSSNDNVQIPNSAILLSAKDDDAAKGKLDDYNAKLKKMNTAMEYIGDSVKETVLPMISEEMKPYLGETPSEPPADWKKSTNPGTKTTFAEMSAGKDVDVQSADPANPQKLTLKLVLGFEARTVDPTTDDKPVILSKAELLYNEGDITIAYDPYARKVIRTEIKRATPGTSDDTASAMVYGRAVVVPITMFPGENNSGNHRAIQVLSQKSAKDTSPSSITFLMLALWILALIVAIPMTWLANRGRYTMQLGIVEKEPEVEPEALDEDADIGGGDIGGEPEPENLEATGHMDDDFEIS